MMVIKKICNIQCIIAPYILEVIITSSKVKNLKFLKVKLEAKQPSGFFARSWLMCDFCN